MNFKEIVYSTDPQIEYINKDTIAILTIDNIDYVGVATLHSEDINLESNLIGGGIAHRRCIYNVFKDKSKEAKERLMGWATLYKEKRDDATLSLYLQTLKEYKNLKKWKKEASINLANYREGIARSFDRLKTLDRNT